MYEKTSKELLKELLEHRKSCIEGRHAVICCPECGHKMRITVENQMKGDKNE